MISLRKICKLIFEQYDSGKGWFNFKTKQYIGIGIDLHYVFAKENPELFKLTFQAGDYLYDAMYEKGWIPVYWDRQSFGFRVLHEDDKQIHSIQELIYQKKIKPKSFFIDGFDQKSYHIPYEDFMSADNYGDFRSFKV